MKWRLTFLPEAEEDFDKLDGSKKKIVRKALAKIEQNPLPSYEGEPTLVDTMDNIDEFTDMVWNNLNEDNKVSLFVRFVNLEDCTAETRIVNKNK